MVNKFCAYAVRNSKLNENNCSSDLVLWQKYFGYFNVRNLMKFSYSNYITRFNLSGEMGSWEVCELAKSTKECQRNIIANKQKLLTL